MPASSAVHVATLRASAIRADVDAKVAQRALPRRQVLSRRRRADVVSCTSHLYPTPTFARTRPRCR